MQIERLLQINVIAMVLLGTVLLGMGERTPMLPMCMTAAAVLAFSLTDVLGRFWLNRTFVNICAVLALLLSLWRVGSFEGLRQVFVIAELLVYLQVILLFQKKEMRVYWLLMLLSLFEVVVAAAFEQEVWFGFLLFGYLFVGLAAMTFLFLHQEHLRRQMVPPATVPSTRHRWPLANQEASFTSSPGGRAGLGSELVLRMVRMTVAVALIAAVVFFCMPRLGSGSWRQATRAPLTSVGFNDKVTLGELGRVIEDAHEVMRVRLFEQDSKDPYRVNGPLYLRGAVLNQYEQGRWSYRTDNSRRRVMWLPRAVPTPGQRLVRQEITIEPMDRDELFGVWPYNRVQFDRRLIFDVFRQRLTRPADLAQDRWSYQLLTPAVQQGFQVPMYPYPLDAVEPPGRFLEPVPSAGPQGLPGLVNIAKKWAASARENSASTHYLATWMEREFRTSRQFSYSLQPQKRDRHIDPIEDFVTNHRAGHCEYFATALALMLRSQGIPARIIVGYKTDDFNELGQFYQVRQLHAHSWVEAYIRPQDVPEDVVNRFRQWDWSAGGWLRLDPTPDSDELSLTNTLLVRTDRYLFWLDYVWNNYIAEMDWSRQRRAIYDPAVQVVTNTGRNLIDPDWWRQFLASLGQMLHLEQWIRWEFGAGLLGTLALAVVGYRGLRRVARPYLSRWGLRRTRPIRRRTPQVEFYRRLETILARHGLVRAAAQTPRELALLARSLLSRETGDSEVADLPGQLVDAFYRVRFGGASLDKMQSQAVELALRQLEKAVRSTSHENRAGRLQGIGKEHAV